MTGQGGWPLTAFLTPDGKPFFGGTYFPPEDAMGRPGFAASCWRSPKLSARAATKWTVRRSPRRSRGPSRSLSGARANFDPSVVDAMVESIAPHVRSAQRRLRPIAKISPRRRDRSAAGALPIHARTRACFMVAEQNAGKNGPRRRLRSTRRRLPPLFGGRALAGAALRENVLRQFRTAEKLSPRLSGNRAARSSAKPPKASSTG